MVSPGGADHDVHRLPAVFVVAGLEGVVKKALVILRRFQDADAALGQEGVAVFDDVLCDHRDLLVVGKLQCGEKTGAAAADDHDILLFHTDAFLFSLSLLCQFQHALQGGVGAAAQGFLQRDLALAGLQDAGDLLQGDELHVLAYGCGLHEEEFLVRVLPAQLIADAAFGDDDVLLFCVFRGIVQDAGGTADVVRLFQHGGHALRMSQHRRAGMGGAGRVDVRRA